MLSLSKAIYILFFISFAMIVANGQDVVLEEIQRGDKVVVIAKNNNENSQLVTLNMTLENVVSDKALPLKMVIKPGEKKELLVLSPIPLKAWSYKTQYSFEEYLSDKENSKVHGTSPRLPDDLPGAQNNSGQSDLKIDTADRGTDAKTEVAAFDVDYYSLPPDNADDSPMPAIYARRITRVQHEAETTVTKLPAGELLLFGQAGCPRCTMVRDFLNQNAIPYKEMSITGNDENQQLMNRYLFDSGFEGGQFMMPVVIAGGETHYSIKDLSGFLESLKSDY